MNNNNNTIDPIKCPACLTPFDTDKHLPRISPACGHTLCKECLVQALKMDTPKCPLDKLKFGKDFRTLDVFPTNFLGKDLLEVRGKWKICEVHQEQQKMICLTDHTLICGSCVLFGEHRGHKVKKLENFKEILSQKKSQLSAVAQKISKISCEFKDDLEQKKKTMKRTIKNRFQSFYVEIQKQELSMLLELENIFSDAEIKLRTSLDMPFDIESKIKEFNKAMSNPNIAKLAEEDFSTLDKVLDEKVALLKTKHFEEVSELLAVFQNNLPKEVLLKDLNLTESLNRELMKLVEKRNVESTAFQSIQELIILPVELKITKKSENNLLTLNVRGSDTLRTCALSRTELDQIKKGDFDFEFDNDIIDEVIFSRIRLLSRSLKNLKSVVITAECPPSFEGRCEAKFFHLLSAIFSELNENLEEIDIYVKKAPIKDIGMLKFAENLLPRFKNLKTFSLTLNQTKTTSKALQALSKVDFSNLQKFHVNIKRCLLDEESLIEFLNRIPNVQALFFGFGATPLTDKAFDSFSTRTLPSLTNVKSLFMGVWETDLSDEGAQKLLNNVPNVEILDIDIGSTKVTDEGVREFVDDKLPTLTNLKDFELHLKDTKVSKSLLDQVHRWERKFKQNGDSQEEENSDAEEEEDGELSDIYG